jgi:NADPH-dependent curcumin reductase CurA
VVPADAELPLTAHLSVLSFVIGLTAWVGVADILNLQKGETFVVSGGSGAVGSLAGQLAKMRGARVIGIVGSEEKARWLTETVGFDAAVIYQNAKARNKTSSSIQYKKSVGLWHALLLLHRRAPAKKKPKRGS